MTRQFEAVVVGGGVVGAAVAFELADRGVDACLVDDRRPGRATDAGAGIVSPPTSSRRADDAWFAFADRAGAHYPDLVDRLRAAGVDDTGYQSTELVSLGSGFDAVARRRVAESRHGDGTVEALDADAVRALCPVVGDVDRAGRFDRAARVDGATLTRALLRAGEAAGLATREATVESILVEGGAVAGVVDDDSRRVAADAVVVAGGAWSGQFGDDLGLDLPVSPTRGQILHFDAGVLDPDPPVAEWPILVGPDDYYAVPWPDGRVAVGATREADSGFDPRATAAGVDRVLDAALEMLPGLADATFREVKVGLRPGTPDGLPVVGAAPGVDGAYLATGHGPTGLTLGPYTGAVVADLVTGTDPAGDLSAFAPNRF